MHSGEPTRRELLTGGALIAGAAVALSVGLRGADARAQGAADVPALNALLASEYGLMVAYDALLSVLAMPLLSDPARSLAPSMQPVLRSWRGHHGDHAEVLSAAVRAAGGTPVPAGASTFSPPAGFLPTVGNALRLACNSEKAAAVAYTRAMETLGGADHARIAAAIGGDESQHFIVLYLMVKGIASPGPQLATMVGELVPRAFVSLGRGDARGLSTVADIPFAPLA